MLSIRQLFLAQVAQTSDIPMMLEVDHTKGVNIYDTSGKAYIDMNSGISVSSLGHGNPLIIEAIQNQAAKYLHTMVYGEHVQRPQVSFANKLIGALGAPYESLYYLMSGTEATELGMKLAKRYTGRSKIIACRNAYHGSTQGAESLRSDDEYKSAFLPLLPGIEHIDFNDLAQLDQIDQHTAGVICEPVQAEAGVITPQHEYLNAIQKRCDEVDALFILDEIQTGFGRTGKLFAQQKYNVQPDITLIGKAMGGGMPIAGVVSSHQIMGTLTNNPVLGHITTFGGHPVSCAAAEAAFDILINEDIVAAVLEKEAFIHEKLRHPILKEIRSSGLMMAVEPTSRKYLKHIVSKAFELGVVVDWFLFNNRSFRLAPPLVISFEELDKACDILLKAMDYAQQKYAK